MSIRPTRATVNDLQPSTSLVKKPHPPVDSSDFDGRISPLEQFHTLVCGGLASSPQRAEKIVSIS